MKENHTWGTVIAAAIQNRLKQLHTMSVGVVIAVNGGDSENNATVDVEIQIQRGMVDPENTAGDLLPTDVPLLIRVPIGMYKSGGFSMSFPIHEGTEGLVFFAERNWGIWKDTQQKLMPDDFRMHHFSDAIFIPLPISNDGRIQDYDPENFVLQTDPPEGGESTFSMVVTPTGEVTITSPLTHFEGAVTMSATLDVGGIVTGADFAPDNGAGRSLEELDADFESHVHPAGNFPAAPNDYHADLPAPQPVLGNSGTPDY